MAATEVSVSFIPESYSYANEFLQDILMNRSANLAIPQEEGVDVILDFNRRYELQELKDRCRSAASRLLKKLNDEQWCNGINAIYYPDLAARSAAIVLPRTK